MMKTSTLSRITDRLLPLSDTPDLDASVLLAHVAERSRTWVLAHPELVLSAEQQRQLDDSLARLEEGESFPYVLGHWEFFGRDFAVTPDVLIPRPETELLVERAIAWLRASPRRRLVADVGTGSGAIAISIATHVPDVRVVATDVSARALEVARANAARLDVGARLEFVQCDLLPEPPASPRQQPRFDLICANLPYIPTETLHSLRVYGREPALALDGGADGLRLVERLLGKVPAWIAPHGTLLLEIESSLGSRALALARAYFPQAAIELHRDLAGRDRLLQIDL